MVQYDCTDILYIQREKANVLTLLFLCRLSTYPPTEGPCYIGIQIAISTRYTHKVIMTQQCQYTLHLQSYHDSGSCVSTWYCRILENRTTGPINRQLEVLAVL